MGTTTEKVEFHKSDAILLIIAFLLLAAGVAGMMQKNPRPEPKREPEIRILEKDNRQSLLIPRKLRYFIHVSQRVIG